MSPARDRLLGVLIALIVMWVIFHQLRPKRVVDRMRLGLARLLRMEADLLSLIRSRETGRVSALREDVLALVLEVRGIAEAIPFEFDQHVERDTEISEEIQNALTSTVGLFLHARAAWPPEDAIPAELAVAKSINDSIAQGMRYMADMLDGTPRKQELDEIASALSVSRTAAASSESLTSVLSAYPRLQRQILKIQADA
jgi:multidrug resistance protein MdtO